MYSLYDFFIFKNLTRVERKLDFLMDHMELQWQNPKAIKWPRNVYPYTKGEILKLIRAGERSAAIKAFRKATGLSSKEAKYAVDALAASDAVKNGEPDK